MQERILARQVARDLSAEDIAAIGGGRTYNLHNLIPGYIPQPRPPRGGGGGGGGGTSTSTSTATGFASNGFNSSDNSTDG